MWWTLLAAGACLLLGLAVGLRYRRRSASTVAAPRPPVPDEAHDALLAARSALTGLAVLDGDGTVRYANPRSVALGVVVDGVADWRVRSVVGRVAGRQEQLDLELVAARDPERAEPDWAPTSGPGAAVPSAAGIPRPRSVHAVVQPLAGGLVLVSSYDDTDATRLEDLGRDFVANVSHELKTPVAAIALLAEAAGNAADEPELVRRFTGRLVIESQRLGSLVNELIMLSRLQGADALHNFAVVEVDPAIGEAIARTATLAESGGITVVAGPPHGLRVLGDRPMLVTALANLIDNAVHYSQSGTTVSISTRSRDHRVEVAVTDRGIGIAPEHQDRVFERFFRVDPARSRATGGTGLGLAIVKHVADNHGGTATVWSKPGTGSTFTLVLPEYSAATAEPAEPDSARMLSGMRMEGVT